MKTNYVLNVIKGTWKFPVFLSPNNFSKDHQTTNCVGKSPESLKPKAVSEACSSTAKSTLIYS